VACSHEFQVVVHTTSGVACRRPGSQEDAAARFEEVDEVRAEKSSPAWGAIVKHAQLERCVNNFTMECPSRGPRDCTIALC
jgi:hypothetical protein